MAHYKGAASEAGRAMQLMKKREKEMQDLELRKKRIEEDLKLNNIENKFATHYDAVEQQLKSSTIGLVTLDEMKAKQENIVKEREKKLAQKQAEKEREKQRQLEAKLAEKNKQKKQLTFRYNHFHLIWMKMKKVMRMKNLTVNHGKEKVETCLLKLKKLKRTQMLIQVSYQIEKEKRRKID